MAMNRVQFQPGLSMSEFFERYGTEEKCEAALFASRWPSGWRCPVCQCATSTTFMREGRRYWQCSAQRHQSTLTSGSVFEATKLPLTRWFLAMHLLTRAKNNLSALELMRHLGVCYKTALLLKHKLMEVMRLPEDSRQLNGRVEIDDAYLGGERSGGKRGRGSENKVPFIAAVQTTEDGQVVLACFAPLPFTKEAVSDELRLSQTAGTMMACMPPLMDLERKVLKVIGITTGYRIDGEQLTLLADGQALTRFESVYLR